MCTANKVDRGRMDELREEIGLRKNLKGRIVEKRLKWTGHVERMAEDRLTKRGDAHGEEGRRRRGRPRLRWEDCMKRDARNAGLEGNRR